MTPAELRAHRRITRAYIQAEPFLVVLTRTTKEETAAGGWIEKPLNPPLDPQVVRIIPFKRRMTNAKIDSQFGDIHYLDWSLLGLHDLDVQESDRFEWRGNYIEVKTVEHRDEKTLCHLVDRGPVDV